MSEFVLGLADLLGGIEDTERAKSAKDNMSKLTTSAIKTMTDDEQNTFKANLQKELKKIGANSQFDWMSLLNQDQQAGNKKGY